jgi:hypothetical protein
MNTWRPGVDLGNVVDRLGHGQRRRDDIAFGIAASHLELQGHRREPSWPEGLDDKQRSAPASLSAR